VKLREAAEQLYALPLEDFTASRNALAKELRSTDRELGDAVRRLPKPALAAWVVNTLARGRPAELDELLELGAQLREAQQDLAGDALRDLTAQAHPLVREVTKQSLSAAVEAGAEPSDVTARQVEQTLRAAMADEQTAAAVRAGMLTRPLKSVGFGGVDLHNAVAVEVEGAGTRTRKRGPAKKSKSVERKRADAQRAVKAALRDVEQAESEVGAREEQLESASADHARARERVQQLREQLDASERQESALGAAVRDARAARENAVKRARTAFRAAERAQVRLERLT
jgi:hypothetical protein